MKYEQIMDIINPKSWQEGTLASQLNPTKEINSYHKFMSRLEI